MKISAFRFLFLVLVAGVLSLNAQAQSLPGQIKAAKTKGVVMKISASAPGGEAIKDGDVLGERDTVTTGNGSSVVLVMVNGSTMSLGPDSRLAIEEFQVDPFADPTRGAKVDPDAERSKSKTTLNLTYGELVGNVKKMKPGSTYLVKTPVGSAGIRGTTFQLTYRSKGKKSAYFSLSTASGAVLFQDATGNPLPVVAGKEITVTVTVNDLTGKVESVIVSDVAGISPEAKAAIETQVKLAVEAAGATTFTAPASDQNATPTGDTGKKEGTPPSLPTAPPIVLTPGAGKG